LDSLCRTDIGNFSLNEAFTLDELAEKPADIRPEVAPIVELPVKKLQLSRDVPNFKENADPKTGVVQGEALQGKVDRRGLAPIIAWRRLNGDVEVISGRHRLDLFRRNQEETIPTQISSILFY
jgi:hypothetical protein